ncbi:MAG: hypothetical protein LIP03_15600 [Bacteroidales bacterium]|nr:hypothetical protein [Bacteroidales bacterium]
MGKYWMLVVAAVVAVAAIVVTLEQKSTRRAHQQSIASLMAQADSLNTAGNVEQALEAYAQVRQQYYPALGRDAANIADDYGRADGQLSAMLIKSRGFAYHEMRESIDDIRLKQAQLLAKDRRMDTWRVTLAVAATILIVIYMIRREGKMEEPTPEEEEEPRLLHADKKEA